VVFERFAHQDRQYLIGHVERAREPGAAVMRPAAGDIERISLLEEDLGCGVAKLCERVVHSVDRRRPPQLPAFAPA